jgi:hypothetical protein
VRSQDERPRPLRLLGAGAVALAIVVVFSVLRARSGCTPGGVDLPPPPAEAAAPVDAGDDANAPLSARCGDREGLTLPPGVYEMGDALVTKDKVFIGVAHDVGGKHQGALVTLVREGDALSSPTVVDEGDLAPDAPPPKAVVFQGKPLLAMVVAEKGARALAVGAMRIAQQNDVSFAFDVATQGEGGLVAWDEDAANAPRGVVKVATLPHAPDGQALVVSAESSDADSPRVAVRPGGYWVAWLARKPEPERDAAPELEGPGEKRHLTWLEVAQVDASGHPIGAPMRVGKAGSRVESFDMLAHDDALDILVKDDEQPADEEGSRLVLVTLRGAEVVVRVIVERGVGRGIPDLLGARAAFVDLAEHARLLPIAPGGRASVEPELDNARPLASLELRLLAGFPKDSITPLGVLRCFDAPRLPGGKQ